ncbi:GNAT family N-acetyltransferase [Desulfosporosinus shakirovi]|uniref:GNAT family N-acetyltransferase n=1 Tax=Desulfosporosinus shakirovi TaxID=2885154 RepID=UPI001E2BD0DE|nr:GNAT family N-acetyltransferase [Desulfosporosinus sp. SRJS8]MCB8814529.1 GNAT family N-acetyltransferase [Desulfosporosinus sp. SRJS8]
MDIKVREAVINDYESLCEIYVELDEQHRLNHPELFIKPEDYARAKEYISEIIKDSNKALFVADIDTKVVAFAECFIQKSSEFPVIKKREWVQLDSIAVKRNYHNYHIGSLLLGKVVEWAESKEMKRIELKVYSFNKYADEFYLRKGFKDLSKAMYLDL